MDLSDLLALWGPHHLHSEEDWRIANRTVDYQALNRQTKKDVYPLPCIDDLLDKLSKARFLSAIDLASGYH